MQMHVRPNGSVAAAFVTVGRQPCACVCQVIGMGIEGFGFLNLFGDFFPIAVGFLRNMPIIGNILSLPVVRSLTDRFVQKARLPV
eukprot:6114429-Pleurochrysis_carterae.AAC.4